MLDTNIKKIIAAILPFVAVGFGSAFASHSLTTKADEKSAAQLVEEAKEELTESFSKQLQEIKTNNEEKDKQIQELQTQLSEANQKLQNKNEVKETTEEVKENYATKPYVDNKVNSAKQEVKQETKAEVKADTQQQVNEEFNKHGFGENKPTIEPPTDTTPEKEEVKPETGN
ncbi:MAG: hypothetical protein E7214_14965 [Clostridium sp.]|nr:hypothetical protein [Clostridium sp.]